MTFQTIALLKGTAGTAVNNFASVFGYYKPGDGGGGDFYWDEMSNEVDNGGTIFQVTGSSAPGRWKRRFSGPVYFKWFGAVADGETDDSVYMQRVINAFSGGNFSNNENLAIESDPNAVYAMANPVFVPYNVSINFNNATIRPLGGNGFPGQFMFYLNANADGSVVSARSESFPSYISNIYLDNRKYRIDGICVFYSRSKHLIENIRTEYVQTLYNAAGIPGGDYNGAIRLNRVLTNDQPTGTANYINISGLGDNLRIEDIDLHGGKLNIEYCQGVVLDRILNADITINSCFGLTISNAHLENGNINIKNSMVRLSNILHFYRGKTPLTITNDNNGNASLANKTCVIENYSVEYNYDRNSPLESAYSSDVYDALINGNVIINNFFRAANYNNAQYMTCTATRITRDGCSPFDDYNYNPANSISCTVVNGRITSTIQNIHSGVQNTSYIGASGEKFLEAPGTYYYRAVILLGDSRCLLATSTIITPQPISPPFYEVSASLNAPSITNPILRSGASFTLRIYRGTSSGIYSHMVDIPFTSFDNIVDYGFYTNTGHYWKIRTLPGPVDTFNTATTASYFTQNSDGSKFVKLNAIPVSGIWKVGDKVEKITPDTNGIGWICSAVSPLTFIPL